MKKRFITLALALVMLFTLAIPAFAAITTETSGTTPLTYEVAQSFTVTIPALVTITDGTGTGTVSVEDSIIPYGEDLTVTITAATNYDSDNSKFRLKDGVENYLDYTIKVGDTTVALNTPFLTVASGTATGSKTLDFAATATKAGDYTDQLTFTVAVD